MCPTAHQICYCTNPSLPNPSKSYSISNRITEYLISTSLLLPLNTPTRRKRTCFIPDCYSRTETCALHIWAHTQNTALELMGLNQSLKKPDPLLLKSHAVSNLARFSAHLECSAPSSTRPGEPSRPPSVIRTSDAPYECPRPGYRPDLRLNALPPCAPASACAPAPTACN